MSMDKLEIYLKSGAVIQVDAADVETERNRITGDLTAIRWTAPEHWKRKLHSVNLQDIAAVVVTR